MSEKLLIVDDSRDIRDFLRDSVFSTTRFEIVMASDGVSGLNMALTARPDVIITDMQMPHMSGLEMLRRLHQKGLRTPAILMTAFGSEKIAVEALRLGVRDYVIKPFAAEEIATAVERALRESRLERDRNRLLQELQTSNAELERNLQEFNTIYSVSRAFTTSLDLESVLHGVAEAAVQLTRGEESYLMLVDKEQDELYMRASKSADKATQSLRLQVEDSLAGGVMRTQRPLVIGDEAQWQKIKTAYLVKSLVYVPLIVRDQAIGVLGVANRIQGYNFSQRDVRVLSTLANYAAAAIHNAQLYQEAQEQADELAQALARLREYDKLKNEILQNVSHELRTPLALMSGYADLMVGGELGVLNKEQHDAVEIVARRSKMLMGLVDDLTTILIAPTQQPLREPVDLVRLVEMMRADFQVTARDKGIMLQVETSAGLPPIQGDAGQLRRVLDNLVGNAMKFTPSGGMILVRLYQDQPHLFLEVSDTGVGIPEERLERIFERFYQGDASVKKNYGGTGLGLALVKEIVESHGGRVNVRSSVGQGSTFRVTLPVTEPAHSENGARPPDQRAT